MPWFLSAIGESIRLRTLKGKPERAIRCLHVPRTAYNRSHVNFAPPAHPSAGAIGASLVVNCRAINSRRPALETFQRIDLIDFVDERAHADLARAATTCASSGACTAAVGTALRARSPRHRDEYQPTYRTKCSNRSGIWWQSNFEPLRTGHELEIALQALVHVKAVHDHARVRQIRHLLQGKRRAQHVSSHPDQPPDPTVLSPRAGIMAPRRVPRRRQAAIAA